MRSTQAPAGDNGRERGVYAISVAAELTGVPIQTLRLYERHGLLVPDRSSGGTRRYSERDLERVRRVAELTRSGVNLTGIEHVLRLEQDRAGLQTALDALADDHSALRDDHAALTERHTALQADHTALRRERDGGRPSATD